jgi:nitroreductase
MNDTIKTIAQKVFGNSIFQFLKYIRKVQSLKNNYRNDYLLYRRHSSVFKKDNFGKKESEITLIYHSIEKGLLHKTIRYRFAKEKIIKLIKCLEAKVVLENDFRTQIQAAYVNLVNYYNVHKENKIDISSYFPEEKYIIFRNRLKESHDSCIKHSDFSYFSQVKNDFEVFSNSRCSVRSYTGELIDERTFQLVVNLANNAPSVCNRQPTKVHLIQNRELISKIFDIQGGLKGYTNSLKQMIVLTSDRNYFYSVGERNQLYVDGGIYLMNLLYALHYYQIAACPAHWGMPSQADLEMRKLLGFSESHQIICLIAVGIPPREFSTTLSLRKTFIENLSVIK